MTPDVTPLVKGYMTSTILPRPRGQPLEFPATQLEIILARLTASGQAYVEFGGVAYWRFSGFGLLLVFTDHFPNRRLLEQFTLSYDASNFEGLAFQKDACGSSLAEALVCIGWQLPVPLTLGSVYMAKFLTGAQKYVQEGQLCSFGGAWAAQPATLRGLTGHSGISVTTVANDVRVGLTEVSLDQLPPTVIRYLPTTIGPGNPANLTAIPGVDVWRVPSHGRVIMDFTDPVSITVGDEDALPPPLEIRSDRVKVGERLEVGGPLLVGGRNVLEELDDIDVSDLTSPVTIESASMVFGAASQLEIANPTNPSGLSRLRLSANGHTADYQLGADGAAVLRVGGTTAVTLDGQGSVEVADDLVVAGRNVMTEVDARAPKADPTFTGFLTAETGFFTGNVSVARVGSVPFAQVEIANASGDAASTSRLRLTAVSGGQSRLEMGSSGLALTTESAQPIQMKVANTTVLTLGTGASKPATFAGDVTIQGNLTISGATTSSSTNSYTKAEVDGLLAAKASVASPTFTGTPSVPTASAGTSTTQIASTAFVQAAVAGIVASAPETLNTLDELAAALGDDPNFATSVTTAIGLRATTSDVNTALALKADAATTYTRSQVDTSLASKADSATTYTRSQVDTALALRAPLASPSFTGNITASGSTQADSFSVMSGTNAVWSIYKFGTGPESVDMGTGSVMGAQLPLNFWCPMQARVSLTVLGQPVVLANDLRLADARNPLPGSVTNAAITDGALAIAKVSGLQTALNAKLDLGSRVLSLNGSTFPAQKPALNLQLDGTTAWSLSPDTSDGTLRLQRRTGLGMADVLVASQGTGNMTIIQNLAVTGDLAVAGRLTVPAQPAAFVRYSGTVNVGTTVAKISPNVAVYNQGGLWNPTLNRFDIAVTGVYTLSAGLSLTNRSASNQVIVSFRLNGAFPSLAFVTQFFCANLSFTYQFTAGDVVEVFASSPQGATTVVTSSESYASVALLY